MKRRKLSKTLGNFQSPSVISLMRLIETQSKATLVKWSTDYVEKHILPIYENAYPTDDRPRLALRNAVGWLEGRVRFSDAKQSNYDAHAAATAAEGNPAAQAAARACAHAALTIHVVAHCLGIVFYGTTALAYAQAGLDETPEVYDEIAIEECKRMEDALRLVAVENESNPAKIDWKLWNFIIK
ncbi:MAG: putative immunity protein [Erysipelotrichaceae bacterium]